MNKTLRAFLLLLVTAFGAAPQAAAHNLNLPGKPLNKAACLGLGASQIFFAGLIAAIPGAFIDFVGVEPYRQWDHSWTYHMAEAGDYVPKFERAWYASKVAFILGAYFLGWPDAKNTWKNSSPQGCVDGFDVAFKYLTTFNLVCDKNVPESRNWTQIAGPGCDKWPLVNLARLLRDHQESLNHAINVGTFLVNSAKTYKFPDDVTANISTKITELKSLQDLVAQRIAIVANEPDYAEQVELERKQVDTITRNNRTIAERQIISTALANIRKKMGK